MNQGVHLLAYADPLAGDLAGTRRLLTESPLAVFRGAHVLPFFVPFDGVDAGFDPVDHTAVDPRLGTWADLRALADAGIELTADLIVNHVSARSALFADWLAREDVKHDGMFLTYDTVFPSGAREEDLTAFYRPRPGLPFTPYQRADGTRRLVWTTFRPDQVDLDVHSPAARAYLAGILDRFAASGVRTVRLDAVGYAVKTPGTGSFLTEHTLDFVAELTALAHRLDLRVLVEVHGHYRDQQRLAEVVDYVYDFALPPLLLHALGAGDLAPLGHWLEVRPHNAVTVLDTHDGMGVVDAGPWPSRPGLLDERQVTALFAQADRATLGESTAASRVPAWSLLPHQINSTFFSVLGADPTAYLLARAVQLFLPGLPQVYYVGLLGGRNDPDRAARTGDGREINRHVYGPDELAAALRSALTRAQLALIIARTRHPAFGGEFAWDADERRLRLTWTAGADRAVLDADVTPGAPAFRVELTGRPAARSVPELARWDG